MVQFRQFLSIFTALAWAAAAHAQPAAQVSKIAGWHFVADGNQCLVLLPPDKDRSHLVALGISRETSGQALMMVVSPYLARIGNGLHGGEIDLDGHRIAAPILMHVGDGDTPVTVAVPLPGAALDEVSAVSLIDLRLDGRRLIKLDLPGRKDMVKALQDCASSLSAAPPGSRARPHGAGQSVKPDATDPLAAAEAAGLRVASGASVPTVARTKTAPDADPLAAAEAAGLRVAATEGPAAAPPGANGTDAALTAMAQAGAMQAQSDTFLMMFRMNNYLANGGSMADPNMGAVMMGLEY